MLFNFRCKSIPHDRRKLVEQYLVDYCSESLNQLSLEGIYYISLDHYLFEDTQKQLRNVKILHVERCRFKKELPFKRVFPNLLELKLGYNVYHDTSAIRAHFPSLKCLWFFADRGFWKRFREKDIEELFKLNPQLESATYYSFSELSSNFIKLIKGHCPNIQFMRHRENEIIYLDNNVFSFRNFICEGHSRTNDRDGFCDKNKIYPLELSDKYLNHIGDLVCLYNGPPYPRRLY